MESYTKKYRFQYSLIVHLFNEVKLSRKLVILIAYKENCFERKRFEIKENEI